MESKAAVGLTALAQETPLAILRALIRGGPAFAGRIAEIIACPPAGQRLKTSAQSDDPSRRGGSA